MERRTFHGNIEKCRVHEKKRPQSSKTLELIEKKIISKLKKKESTIIKLSKNIQNGFEPSLLNSGANDIIHQKIH